MALQCFSLFAEGIELLGYQRYGTVQGPRIGKERINGSILKDSDPFVYVYLNLVHLSSKTTTMSTRKLFESIVEILNTVLLLQQEARGGVARQERGQRGRRGAAAAQLRTQVQPRPAGAQPRGGNY